MTNDPLFIEMMGADDLTSGRHAAPTGSSLDDPLFAFQRSTGEAELWAAKLMQRAFAEELLGTHDLSKRLREGLFDITPPASSVRLPISPNSYKQEPLTLPDPLSDEEMRSPQSIEMCDCACPPCRERGKCAECSAATKCKCYRSDESTKAVIARMVGRMRGKLHPHGRSVPKAAWRGLEAAMLRYVRKAVSDASL